MSELILTLNAGLVVGEIRRLRPRSRGSRGAGLGPDRRIGRGGDLPRRVGVGGEERICLRRKPRPRRSSRRRRRDPRVARRGAFRSRNRRRRPPHRAWRSRLRRARSDRRRAAGEAAPAHSARAAASAAQSGWRRGGARRLPGDAAGRLLRHGVSPQPPVRLRHVRAAALVLRGGRAALRLSRPLLRIHRAAAARGRAGRRRRPRDRRPSGQRRLDVRDARRPLGRLDHGLHRARRPADGHALRPARSGRRALSDGREGHERGRDRGPSLQGVGPLGHVRPFAGHARPRGFRQPRRARRDRLFRRAHTARDRRPRGGGRRRRRDRLHRRHRRKLLARSRGGVVRHGMDRRSLGSAGEPQATRRSSAPPIPRSPYSSCTPTKSA